MTLIRRSRCACDVLLDRNGKVLRKRLCLFHSANPAPAHAVLDELARFRAEAMRQAKAALESLTP